MKRNIVCELTIALTLPFWLRQIYRSWDGEYNLVMRLEVLGSPATQLSLTNLTATEEKEDGKFVSASNNMKSINGNVSTATFDQ